MQEESATTTGRASAEAGPVFSIAHYLHITMRISSSSVHPRAALRHSQRPVSRVRRPFSSHYHLPTLCKTQSRPAHIPLPSPFPSLTPEPESPSQTKGRPAAARAAGRLSPRPLAASTCSRNWSTRREKQTPISTSHRYLSPDTVPPKARQGTEMPGPSQSPDDKIGIRPHRANPAARALPTPSTARCQCSARPLPP